MGLNIMKCKHKWNNSGAYQLDEGYHLCFYCEKCLEVKLVKLHPDMTKK